MRGVHGIVASVIEEVANIVGTENLNKPLVFGPVFFKTPQFVARRSKRATRCMPEGRDCPGAFLIGVDHVFSQRADNAVAAGINVGNLVAMLACCLDDTTGARIDDCGNTARLGIERVSG